MQQRIVDFCVPFSSFAITFDTKLHERASSLVSTHLFYCVSTDNILYAYKKCVVSR
jgi:hypothetical protein